MKTVKIAFIGNYPPRECGIATFTRDLVESLIKNDTIKDAHINAYVVALNDNGQAYAYPPIVRQIIRQSYQQDYLQVAKYINYSDVDVCILQHEFGIFGGDSGIYILPLLYRLEIPLIVTFHTVLQYPSYNEKAIIQEIGKRAEKIIVMSKRAIDFLVTIYGVPKEKIALIEHGVPDFELPDREKFKKKFNLENKKALLTFGLLNRNKGIETVIEALPKVVQKHPDLIYIVLGKTHPSVVKAVGEEYRNYLLRLSEKYGLRKHVYFKDSFVDNVELFGYLSAIDIYITPYLSRNQITSGTLAYAIGAGAAVVSTPYWHAEELLDSGRGRLFDFGDNEELANILCDLLDDPQKLHKLRGVAYEYGRRTTWPQTGIKYCQEIIKAKESYQKIKPAEDSILNLSLLPDFSLNHVERLTDGTGIIQHAKFNVPNLREGYCMDDNGRALLMCLMAVRQKKDRRALALLPIYLSYMHYAQNDDGTFRNFLSYNRDFLDEVGTEDSTGRAIWALGYLVRYPPTEAYFQIGRELFSKAYPHFRKLKYIRGIANHIIGISHYLHRYPSDEGMGAVLKDLTEDLIQRYQNTRQEDWRWFETRLSYDNGIIPLALLESYGVLGDKRALDIAIEAIGFLENHVFIEGYLSLIGSDNWYEKGGNRSKYAQQPVDAMAMVLMYYQAYVVTKDKEYLQKMFSSYLWFLGENDLRISMYDFETSGCCDGLEGYGVNRNQGAESTLAYFISHLTVLLAHIEIKDT